VKTHRDYLLDMLEYTYKVAEFTSGGKDTFLDSEQIQFAVIRAYEVIGEIAKQLPDELLAQQPQVEWKRIKGFRDYLAHHYEEVSLKILWEAVEKLPYLQLAIQNLIAGLPPDS
jgi:uncharacterized protein with HEPN domain